MTDSMVVEKWKNGDAEEEDDDPMIDEAWYDVMSEMPERERVWVMGANPNLFWLVYWRQTYAYRLKKPDCELWRLLTHMSKNPKSVGQMEERLDDCMQWLVDERESRHPCMVASRTGSIPLLERLKAYGYVGGRESTIDAALTHGHPHVLEWLMGKTNSQHGKCKLLEYAAYHGDLDLAKQCIDDVCVHHKYPLEAAVKGGHLHILEWFVGFEDFVLPRSAFAIAILRDHMHIVRWFHANNYLPPSSACTAAAQKGDLKCLQWLREIGTPWNQETTMAAAEHGHFDVLKWAHRNGCPWNTNACAYAAYSGHFDILVYLIENHCPYSVHAISNAAFKGHVDIVKYLHGIGMPLTTEVFHRATTRWALKDLEWLVENGCPWNSEAYYGAAFAGRMDVIEWLHRKGCPLGTEAFCGAVHGGRRIEMLKWLHENGFPWNSETACIAVEFGSFETLKYVRENGCPWDVDVCIGATMSGRIFIHQWTHKGPIATWPCADDPCAWAKLHKKEFIPSSNKQ